MHAPEQKRREISITYYILRVLFYRFYIIDTNQLHELDFCLRIDPHILDDISYNSSLVEVQADPLGKDSSV
jgi:hypothetical protein